MQYSEDSLQDLQKCTVAIQRRGKSGIRGGTGVIVTKDGIILTCYHVVGSIQSKSLDEIVDIRFPLVPEIKAHAQPINGDPILDIALLRLQEKGLPKETNVANLGEVVYLKEHNFQSLGFRNPSGVKFVGLPANGMIQGKTRIEFKDGTFSPPVIILKSDQIDEGMSGAPVLDNDTNRVIGIISDHYKTYYQTKEIYNTLSLAIPVESIIQAYPELKQKNPGLNRRLSNISEFLNEIRLEGELYQLIDDVYVPPVEYDDICNAIAKDKIVFIVGTKEYGKTYTAIKLLWGYYKKGYKPKYIQTREEEKRAVRNELAGLIQKELTPKTIIYFEDPFGKVRYQSDEEVENEIGTVIDAIRNSPTNAYIIITSREEVFKEFEYKSIAEKLIKYEKSLNIKTPSYGYEKRKEMLIKWAKAKKCKWLKDEYLTNLVLNTLRDKGLLSSPLKIRDYAISTVGVATEKELLGIMKEKSQETARSFGNEIKEMEMDKILFLMFPFISDSFSEKFVKSNYEILVSELNIQHKAWEYSAIIGHFKRDKISIKDNSIVFSHPSYSEAINYIIYDKRYKTTKVGEMLEKVLLKLADNKDTVYHAATAVAKYFDRLPPNVQNLLFKLADDKCSAVDVAYYAVAYNFDKLPENVRNELLLKLADNTDAAVDVAFTISRNFDKLPENVRNELLLKLADNTDALGYLTSIVAKNFDRLPPNVQNLLFKLADDPYAAGDVASAIIRSYDNLPPNVQDLLIRLANDPYASRYISRDIAYNFYKLPKNMRNELLLKLADKKDTARDVAFAVSSDFYKLPENVRKVLRKRLAKHGY